MKICSILALIGLATSAGAGGGVTFYCDCEEGLGPCGNGASTAVPGGCINSLGLKAYLLTSGGSTSVSADDLILVAGKMPGDQFGIVYMGSRQTQLPFGDGLRCVAPGNEGLFRFPVQNTTGGQFVLGPGIVAHSHAHFPGPGRIRAGDRWNFQGWYRDPGGPCGSGFNLSNALAVAFGP